MLSRNPVGRLAAILALALLLSMIGVAEDGGNTAPIELDESVMEDADILAGDAPEATAERLL